MTVRFNAALAAIAFVCLSSAVPAGAEDHVQMRVSTRGIDVGSAAGLSELSRRVRVAARVACDNGGLDLASQIAAQACRADMEQAGAARIAALSSDRATVVAAAMDAR
jgi:UrcA family protein